MQKAKIDINFETATNEKVLEVLLGHVTNAETIRLFAEIQKGIDNYNNKNEKPTNVDLSRIVRLVAKKALVFEALYKYNFELFKLF